MACDDCFTGEWCIVAESTGKWTEHIQPTLRRFLRRRTARRPEVSVEIDATGGAALGLDLLAEHVNFQLQQLAIFLGLVSQLAFQFADTRFISAQAFKQR